MKEEKVVLSLLGSAGGVAKSILTLLNHSAKDTKDPIHSFISKAKIYLLDYKQKDATYYQKLFPNLFNQFTILDFDLRNITLFTQHLRSTKTNLVIDVSWADTLEMVACCNACGVAYVNTALENTTVDDNEDEYYGFPLIERCYFFEEQKDNFKNTKAIIGSGMNPGVVQWMAIELMKLNQDKKPRACYIVEHDNSFFQNAKLAKQNELYITWSPECFLDEAILSYPMFMSKYNPLFLYEDVYAVEFKVSLGKKEFYGCLMPHEEVYTLGSLFDFETGFLYRVNDHTTNLMRDHLDDVDAIWDLPLHVLDPAIQPLTGEDLVGVLLVFDDKEVYMYNVQTNKEIYEKYKINATYFQVACGIYSGIATLLLDNLPNGVYYVDELLLETESKYGTYLKNYMKDFVVGENKKSEGLLLDRMRRIDE
ncbi:S-adenosylmethionine decarboxylase related protein [Bacillus tianshenii]|uniref:S-adenosylmethionine decarboxylase related protein n=1 Tax=Sutcliffiella tianshenii TaxID=1463404 RepID=UPI001CD1BAF1|nr:S-adenosylmethionine decarboxylase related protein [Bacillus tianshenii]MCA1318548.1 S-adenosylmethionine decarboxylase related protein [Bacillus tianshenii]